MIHDPENVRRLAKKVHENLAKCALDPEVDPVHDTRTGTRRLQATLEDLVREIPEGEGDDPVRAAATATMKLLKRIRHEAGPVRDLDVHRELLEKLVKRAVSRKPGPRRWRARPGSRGLRWRSRGRRRGSNSRPTIWMRG